MRSKHLFYLMAFVVALVVSCKESTTLTVLDGQGDPPANPFDTINYDTGNVVDVPVDSATFLGLHTHIFSKRCNQPACHDGSFEPDFRTVMGAYNSLVFHGITKNYLGEPLPYRVTPGEPDNSMLYHRLTIHDPPNFERMPSSGTPLPDDQIQLIHDWIADGAKDLYGNTPTPTSTRPTCYGVVAYQMVGNDTIRIDTMRQGANFTPFVALEGYPIQLWFFYFDVDAEGQAVLGFQLGYNKLRISHDPYDFSNAPTLDMLVDPVSPLLIATAYSEPIEGPIPYYQNVTFNPSDYGFVAGDRLYFRSYVQDDDHDPTEIPMQQSPGYMHTYFSFDLQ